MSTAQANEAKVAQEEGLGQRLRIAREERGLSCHEVAAALHLGVSMIEALELNDADKLPGPVFVQGYLRKYARLLEIPEDAILQAYGRRPVPQSNGKTVLTGSPLKPEIRSNHAVVRLVTWVIVFSLLALLVVWWRGYLQWPPEQVMNDPAQMSQNMNTASPVLSGEAEPKDRQLVMDEFVLHQDFIAPTGEKSEYGLEEESPVQVEPEVVEAIQTETSSIEAETMASIDISVPEDEGDLVTGMVLDAAMAPSVTEFAALDKVLPVEPASTVIQEPPPHNPIDFANSIVIEFLGPCWTEIYDASNTFRLVGNMQTGERYVLGGEPPYTFVLGNSQGAVLTIKGRPFDLAPHTRGNVARFTLEREAIPNS